MKFKVNISFYKKILKKYGFFIFVITAFFGILLAGIQYFSNDSYISESKIMVNLPQNESTSNADAISANQGMIDTYSEIIKSDDFLKPIVQDFKELNLRDLRNSIKVEKAENSYVFKISITGKDKSDVRNIGKKITSDFEQSIGQYIHIEKVKVLSSDISSSDQDGLPSIFRFLLIGILTGFCLAMGIVLVKEFVIFV